MADVTVQVLAKALVDSDLMRRLDEYAIAAHPKTMHSMFPTSVSELSMHWATAIFAALGPVTVPSEPVE